MENKSNTNTPKEFNSLNLVYFLWLKRKPLIIISIVAALASAGISLTIEDKYQSQVVLFPAQSNSISKSLLRTRTTGKEDVLAFGEDEEAEQLLQFLNSDDIMNRVIQKYDLMNHYRIKEDQKFPYTKLIKKYNNNISFNRTKFGSVEITVLDHNADTAALIANDIAALVDSVKNRVQKVRAQRALEIVEAEYFSLRDQIREMEDSLTKIRTLGVHDYESQAEAFNTSLAQAISTGNNRAVELLQGKFDVLSLYGSAYISITNKMDYDLENLSELEMKYKNAKVDAEEALPHTFVVNSAVAAERKTYPVRSLIVVLSTFSAFLFSFILFIVIDNIKRFRAQQKA